jgi:methyl-accepting chemotaxis protein
MIMFAVLYDLKIRVQITAAFGFVLLLTISLGLFATQRLAEINSAAENMRQFWLPATRALGDYAFHTMRFRQIEAAALLAETPAQSAKEAATLKTVAANAQRAWTAFEAAIASAVEEQGVATQEISRSVTQAAQGTQEVSANIGSVSEAAQQTGSAAVQVLAAAGELSQNGESLKAQVASFLEEVRAA